MKHLRMEGRHGEKCLLTKVFGTLSEFWLPVNFLNIFLLKSLMWRDLMEQ